MFPRICIRSFLLTVSKVDDISMPIICTLVSSFWIFVISHRWAHTTSLILQFDMYALWDWDMQSPYFGLKHVSVHKKWSFPLSSSSVNVTQTAGNCSILWDQISSFLLIIPLFHYHRFCYACYSLFFYYPVFLCHTIVLTTSFYYSWSFVYSFSPSFSNSFCSCTEYVLRTSCLCNLSVSVGASDSILFFSLR